MLLVEIKKSTDIPEVYHFTDISKQTDCQARHTFHASPEIQELGVIQAIGPYWKYVEYYRRDFRPSPSLSERKDSTFTNTPTPPPALLVHDYQPFLRLTGTAGFLCLETEDSNRGLRVVRERLQQLNVPEVIVFLSCHLYNLLMFRLGLPILSIIEDKENQPYTVVQLRD